MQSLNIGFYSVTNDCWWATIYEHSDWLKTLFHPGWTLRHNQSSCIRVANTWPFLLQTGSTKASIWEISAAKSINDIMQGHGTPLHYLQGELPKEPAAAQRALAHQNTNNEVQIEASSFYEDNGTWQTSALWRQASWVCVWGGLNGEEVFTTCPRGAFFH